jgi:hypothetical protein
MNCENCGLPDDCTTRLGCFVVLRLRPENQFCREQRRKVWCCSDECARQAAFLQLETRSTRETITRLLGGKPISYREFRRLPLEIVKARSERPETIAETRVNTGAKTAKNEVMALPHADPVFGTNGALKTRLGGRPRKWASESERKRDYRDRQREQRQSVST